MRCSLLRLLTVWMVLTIGSTLLFAQNNDKTVQENGKTYLLYTVASGEGFFSIQKKFNVTKEELIEANKDLSEKGLRGGQVLKIPMKGEAKAAETTAEEFHTIVKGESVMGITKLYKITVEELFDWNPDLSASTFTVGRKIRVASPKKSVNGTLLNGIKYVVQPQETLYGLSKRFGITVEELAAANGNITTVNIGQELIIPKYNKGAEIANTVEQSPKNTEQSDDYFSVSKVINTEIKNISVAILFPLGLDSKGDPEMSKRLMEFYRGFILSADSVRKQGIDIAISFYDIGTGTSKIDSIIRTGELNTMDVIIAPPQAEQTESLVLFGQEHDIRIVLPFSSKGEWSNTNSMIIQMNPPVSIQNKLVFDHWKQRYHNANFIFLTSKGVSGEKAEFVQSAKKYLTANKIAFKQYTHHMDSITDIVKMMDPTAENVIVSDFASVRNLKTIILDLQMVAKQQSTTQMILWGYPEWQTFFLEFGDAYFDLNVHLFTTFYADYSNPELKKVESNYRTIYQKNMLNTYPRFGLLGYDMGLYLLSGKFLTKEPMEGLQSGFSFKRADRNKGGLINNNLFVVEYTKEQAIKRLNISDN